MLVPNHGGMLDGEKLAVTLAGSPDTDKKI
jgi:hypothetical protein